MASRELSIHKPNEGHVKDGAAAGPNVGGLERLLSTVGGGALAAYGVKRKDAAGAALAVAGSALALRGLMGQCPMYEAMGVNTANKPAFPLKIQATHTINKTPRELYRFWRRLENLPRFMSHLESVTRYGDGRSHWVAKAPAGHSVSWDAEIINDVEDETLAWRSVEGSGIRNIGAIRFQPAPGGRGTAVHVTLEYEPPAGKAGAMFARLFGEEPSQQVNDDLRRFKQLMEAGEIATTDGQPTGKGTNREQEPLAVALLHSSK